eukprot:8482613-Lingulodinium_polyedra.AAC.1
MARARAGRAPGRLRRQLASDCRGHLSRQSRHCRRSTAARRVLQGGGRSAAKCPRRRLRLCTRRGG